MPEPDVVLPAGELERLCDELLRALEIAPHKARLVARTLIAASLRGVDSHGVQLLPYYVDQIRAGELDVRANGRVLSESGGCLHFDGENALGQWIADQCCDHAVRLCREHGVSFVSARDANHFGAAAWWTRKISDEGMIGMAFCNASPIVPPWQGREGRVGTNPISVSVPGPWQLDMATTAVAAGKVYKAWLNGQPEIPAGWALDQQGVPTTDTQAAYAGMLMPLGGYKGSGLGVMVEMLCGVLSGGAFSTDIGGIRIRGKPVRCSHAFLAIDVARFMPVDEFRERAGTFVTHIKSAAPAGGYDEILVAGDPEWRNEADRCANGIPVGAGTWSRLQQLASELGIPVDKRL
jgi:LDH2 family malate/lactate/ureidoglycolate dehydrogenase